MDTNKVYEINNHPNYKKYGGDSTRSYTSNQSTGTLGFQEVEVGNMSMDYITRPEFEQHQKHMDSRFDNVELKINKAVTDLKEEISKEKVTTKRFWIGISVPAIISIVGVCIQLFT
ncbi:MAG: hypothetical protein L0L09_13860 [Staphylococcus equorum]|uniref:hypothetical protein n=1 Tax=Staphylococcus TaxID=1279 RepID=UPI002553155A|nr:hypothetical protein [Staphylococcus equorum]MDK9870693.1 hypothetical protein [Staphylococcus equorum]MDK9876091.1 hypothetical protein [Staphylococcus equorum]MDN6571934.1 hypothetical protein [Staphylococcus equorum]MDN6612621.1 hypothetical protein [Staphylococcus equorum]